LNVAERGAAGDEGQESIGGIANAAARGREPRVAGLTPRRAGYCGGRSGDAGPIDVTFGADDKMVDLIIVADGTAD
jgi:hypothetical protein